MIDRGFVDRPERPARLTRSTRAHAPLLLALAVVGTVLGGLLIGYEPVGGDPDRLYRPLKSELARALADGRLPFWSMRFGLGVPLVAESHVAAFYPLNVLLYGFFDLSLAYRLSMWLHYVALAGTTYLFARGLGLSNWGSALAGVAFALCGFQAIHSSHEPFYSVMPYLPLALWITERYLGNGRILWLALLALCLGVQWSLGHFQIQTWTGGLVIVTALWRATLDRRAWGRALCVIAATAWGAMLAAVQLGLSWQLAGAVRQTGRLANDLTYYSYPPSHWFELVLPRLVRELRLGPEDPYWFGQQTWGYEAALYVGTIPVILAFIGLCGRPPSRSAALWRVLVPASFAIATMPRWWPQGYLHLLSLPGIGYFRAPARYTLLTSLGVAVLAGEGFDKAISKTRFRVGFSASLAFAGCAAVVAFLWTSRRDVRLVSGLGGTTNGFVWAGLAWLVALIGVLAWRFQKLPAWGLMIELGMELGILFYASTTQWGWEIALPAQSAVMTELVGRSPPGLIGGETENLPVRAGLATAYPYLGFAHADANKSLTASQFRLVRGDATATLDSLHALALKRWLKRCRVRYLVGSHRSILGLGDELGRWRDSALDQMIYHGPAEAANRIWSIVRLEEPFAEAHVARRARTIAHQEDLIERLFLSDDPDLAWFLAEDRVPARADARSARLVSWDGTTATVEHEGACDLVIARTFDAGWRARIDEKPEQLVLSADGGFLAVRIEGSGLNQVRLHYQPARLALYATISLVAAASITGVVAAACWDAFRRRTHATS
jgi:Bacterial membrane protein YfhO